MPCLMCWRNTLSIQKRTIIENWSFFNRILFYYCIYICFFVSVFLLFSIELLSFILSHLFLLLHANKHSRNTIYNNGLQFIIYLWQQSNHRKRQTNQTEKKWANCLLGHFCVKWKQCDCMSKSVWKQINSYWYTRNGLCLISGQ